MKRLIILLLILVVSPVWAATTYYIDPTCGTPGNGTGQTCSGGASDPFDQWSDVTWTAGNSYLQKKGTTVREMVTVGVTGTAGNIITLGAYGTGAAPIIFGSTQLTPWASIGSNHWTITTTSPVSLFFLNTDGSTAQGMLRGSVNLCTVEFDYYFTGTTLTIFVPDAADPATKYSFIESPTRDHCILAYEKDYITVENLKLLFSTTGGVTVYGTNGIIRNNVISGVGPKVSEGGGASMVGTSNTIQSNTISLCGRHGIYTDGVALIELNTVFDCYHSLIDLRSAIGTSSGNIVRYNYLYGSANWDRSNTCQAISNIGYVGSTLTDTQIYYNLIVNGMAAGSPAILLQSYCINYKIYNNTIYNSISGESINEVMFVDTTSTGGDVQNNIVWNVGNNCLYLGGTVTQNTSTLTNNIWYRSGGGDFATANGTGYSNLTTWNALTGVGTDSISDPLFVTNGSNFNLQSGSPAKDVAYDWGQTRDYVSITKQGSAWDIGAYEYLLGSFSGGTFSGGTRQ